MAAGTTTRLELLLEFSGVWLGMVNDFEMARSKAVGDDGTKTLDGKGSDGKGSDGGDAVGLVDFGPGDFIMEENNLKMLRCSGLLLPGLVELCAEYSELILPCGWLVFVNTSLILRSPITACGVLYSGAASNGLWRFSNKLRCPLFSDLDAELTSGIDSAVVFTGSKCSPWFVVTREFFC